MYNLTLYNLVVKLFVSSLQSCSVFDVETKDTWSGTVIRLKTVGVLFFNEF